MCTVEPFGVRRRLGRTGHSDELGTQDIRVGVGEGAVSAEGVADAYPHRDLDALDGIEHEEFGFAVEVVELDDLLERSAGLEVVVDDRRGAGGLARTR